MRAVLLSFGFAAAVLAGAQPASATEDFTLHGYVGPQERRCDDAVARRLPLERVLRDPKAYQGQCISVQAYWASRAAFSEAMSPRSRYANASPEVARYRIGLYLPDDGRASTPHVPVRARIVGIVSDCSCLYGPDTVMVLGYCHYTGGPFMDVRYIKALE